MCTILLQCLKDKLPVLRALANDINANLFDMESILPFFWSHSTELPTWGQFASLLASQQINSASVERVFSTMKQAFKETQENLQNNSKNLKNGSSTVIPPNNNGSIKTWNRNNSNKTLGKG